MIIFQNVTKKYGDNTVLENINFTIEKGSFAYLIGSTGSGKTTIFRLLIRDLAPSDGFISIGEWDLLKLPKSAIPTLRRKVGVIFQDLKLLMDRTVVENVMLPLQMTGVGGNEAKRRSERALIEVGLAGKEHQFPLQLSGGERQRVAIARALVFEPDVILADEPTGNLDNDTTKQIHDLLKEINKKGTTIFMATHNDRLMNTSDHVIVLEKGKIAKDKTSTSKKSESGDRDKEDKKDKVKLEDLASDKK